MENDENTQWFKDAPNIAKAKELLPEGRLRRQAGRAAARHQRRLHEQLGADHVAQRCVMPASTCSSRPRTGGGVITRRAVKAPPDQGGWNLFITWSGAASVGNPIAFVGHRRPTARRAGSAGRPTRRTSCATSGLLAGSLDEQKAIAREMQKYDWDFVPRVWLRAMGLAGRLPQEFARRAGDPGRSFRSGI